MTAHPATVIDRAQLAPRAAVLGRPSRALDDVVRRPYAGYDSGAGHAERFVIAAGVHVPVVVKVLDSELRPPTFVTGPRGVSTVVEGGCAPSYLEVWLPPLRAYTVLGLPLDQLADGIVDLVDVLGPEGRQLGEHVREVTSWGARWRILDDFLVRRAASGPTPSPEIVEALELLRRTGGQEPIGRIAATVGWSHKHLTARFREQIGVAPKTAARLARFDVARRRRAAGMSWAGVAAAAGYADQSHLIRDFRRFTGTTPTQLAG